MAVVALAKALGDSQLSTTGARTALEMCLRRQDPSVVAAAHVLSDLIEQGWAIRVSRAEAISVRPPETLAEAALEKERVRSQELLKRDEQLSSLAVRRFITGMERPREFKGRFVSIFNLMRDGGDLAASLGQVGTGSEADLVSLRKTINPYVQIVDAQDRCAHSGLRLTDIWRYFRHTWTNQYTSTPGRTMLILVRDRAAEFHPIIGIAALGSSIIQIRERDEWIGWQSEQFIQKIQAEPSLGVARWVVQRLEDTLAEIYVDDLVEDGLYWPGLWDQPSEEAITRLLKEAEARRRDHHRFVRRADFKRSATADDEGWAEQAESDLFRSKRCLALAKVLRAGATLDPFLWPTPSRSGLRAALVDPAGRRAIAGVLRQAKAESVGTEMADLTVCGAVAPYNVLLGGKLVAMLAVSPTVVKAYHDKYADYASEIASAVAGRPIRRRTNLAFIGTTSLYGSGSSQYNRIRLPASVLGGREGVEFRQLGKSRSFGTSHFSAETVKALVRVAEQRRTGVRVNSIFGEGVNPKLRKVRDGLDLLGWPSDVLLQHGRRRIIYGVRLVHNLLPYLLGMDLKPDYILRRNAKDDVGRISTWWIHRWLLPRTKSNDVMAVVASHRLSRPVTHGARVTLPPSEDDLVAIPERKSPTLG